MTACTHHCISTPLAWFVIEQYRLGDLDRDAATETERHLANCPACAEVHAYIENDAAVLPPLPVLQKETTAPTPQQQNPLYSLFQRGKQDSPPSSKGGGGISKTLLQHPTLIVGLSAAACILFVLLTVYTPAPKDRATGIAVKGGDLAFSLVRMRGEATAENPTQFEDGDRFRLLLTSPAAGDVPVEVVVFQEDEAFFPYPDTLTAESGNAKGLDGAFTLSGNDDARICVIAGDPIPSRETLQEGGPSALPENSICQMLKAR